MNLTTRGKTDFGTKEAYGLLQPYKQKERIIMAFLTGTPKMTHNLECLQIMSHYIQNFTTKYVNYNSMFLTKLRGCHNISQNLGINI